MVHETFPDGDETGNDKVRTNTDHYFAIPGKLHHYYMIKAGCAEKLKDLYLVPAEIGQVIRCNNAFFDLYRLELRPGTLYWTKHNGKMTELNSFY